MDGTKRHSLQLPQIVTHHNAPTAFLRARGSWLWCPWLWWPLSGRRSLQLVFRSVWRCTQWALLEHVRVWYFRAQDQSTQIALRKECSSSVRWKCKTAAMRRSTWINMFWERFSRRPTHFSSEFQHLGKLYHGPSHFLNTFSCLRKFLLSLAASPYPSILGSWDGMIHKLEVNI